MGDGVLHADGPQRGVDQHATEALVEEVLGGAMGGGEYPRRRAVGRRVVARPGDRQHLLFRVRRGVGVHAVEYLSAGENHRARHRVGVVAA